MWHVEVVGSAFRSLSVVSLSWGVDIDMLTSKYNHSTMAIQKSRTLFKPILNRLPMNPDQVSRCWIESMKMSLKTDGGVYVMQLHPERILLLKNSLVDSIKWAIESEMQIRSLAEITRNGTRSGEHYMAITRDVDIVRLADIIGGVK